MNNTYNFLLWISESGSCIYSSQFTDDAHAIAYLSNLPQGIYQIIKIVQDNPNISFNSIIFDQTLS